MKIPQGVGAILQQRRACGEQGRLRRDGEPSLQWKEHCQRRGRPADGSPIGRAGVALVQENLKDCDALQCNEQEIEKIVIIGFSAGGAGVARNCDFMADRLAALGSTAKVLLPIFFS